MDFVEKSINYSSPSACLPSNICKVYLFLACKSSIVLRMYFHDSGCSPNCFDDLCDTTTNCTNGCKSGHWGDVCNKQCPYQCDGNVCDNENGGCTQGCHLGWYGDTCNKACSSRCSRSKCEQINGIRSAGCVGNWAGDKCDSKCTIKYQYDRM